MIRKTSKLLLRIAAGVLAGLAVLLTLGFWRLSQGPVPLDFALPYLEDGMTSADGSVRLAAREVTLNWAGWDRTLEVRVGSIEAISAGGETLASIPQAAVRLSMLALLRGDIAPTAIQLEKLRLRIVIDEEGRFDIGRYQTEQEGGGRVLSLLVEQLLDRRSRIEAIRQLERVVVTGAEIIFEDRQKSLYWRAPNAEVVLARDEEGVLGEAAVEIDAGGHKAVVNLRALFSREDRSFTVSANFDGVRPAVFAPLDPVLQSLAQVDLALAGTVDAQFSARGELEAMTVNVASGPGTIGDLGVFDASQAVRRTALRGDFNVARGTLRVDSLAIDFDGPKVDLKGEGAISAGHVSFAANLSVDRLAATDLPRFWPAAMSPGGRDWAIANIEGGEARDFRLAFDLTGDMRNPESIRVSNVAGSMSYSGLSVHYLRPMPPVTAVSGTMSMTDAAVKFEVAAGAMGDVAVDNGTIVLSNLDQRDGHVADIDVTATGPLQSLLRTLEHPKVGLPRDLAVKPDAVSGMASVRTIIRLPLIDQLTVQQIEYAASATTSGLAMKQVVAGVDLTDGAMTMQLNGKEMDVRGKAKLSGQPADITWRENFGRAAYQRRYDIRTSTSAADLAKVAGISLPQISGPIGVQAVITETSPGNGSIAASLDLKQALIAVPEIGWRKEIGADAGGRVALDMRNGKPADRIEADLRTADLQAQAVVQLAPDGALVRTDVGRLAFGRHDLAGSVTRTASGYSVILTGRSLDLAPFLADERKSEAAEEVVRPPEGPTVDVKLDVRQVLTRRGKLDGMSGDVSIRGDRVLSADITGRVGPSLLVRTRIGPSEKGRRLMIETADAGAVLKSLGWLEGMFGGDMTLNGEFDDTSAGSPLRGFLRLGEYKLVKTPVVGDVLSVAPLTDALSAFSSSGLEFDRLQAPFRWHRGVLTLNNARTAGTSLGLTATGRINTNNDTVQVEGTIVPAYVVNSLLGNIPLIGPLITGGSGGGLFALNYAVEGPVEKPAVSTNPLSALAPGFLRNLFGAGSGEDATQEAPPPGPRRQPADPANSGVPGGVAPPVTPLRP